MKKTNIGVYHSDHWFLSHFSQYIVRYHGELVSCQTYVEESHNTMVRPDVILAEEGYSNFPPEIPVCYLSTERKEGFVYQYQSAECIYEHVMQQLNIKEEVNGKQALMYCCYLPKGKGSQENITSVCRTFSQKSKVTLLDLRQCSGLESEDETLDPAEALYLLHVGTKDLLPTIKALLHQEGMWQTLGPVRNPFIVPDMTGKEWLHLVNLVKQASECDILVVHFEFLTKGLAELMSQSQCIFSFADRSAEEKMHFKWILRQVDCGQLERELTDGKEVNSDEGGRSFTTDPQSGIETD